jgi:hypothetical protein
MPTNDLLVFFMPFLLWTRRTDPGGSRKDIQT